ncbi:MAG: glycoside hydrolase family 28 protein [Bacteroidota bacterium]
MKHVPSFFLLFPFLLWNCQNQAIQNGSFTKQQAEQYAHQAWKETVANITEQIVVPVFPDKQFLITQEKKFDTDNIHSAVNAAIRHCHQEGGGIVVIPPGEWFCGGPIRLLSNVNLHLQDGASLTFSDQAQDYLPLVKVRWEGTVCWNYSPLIYAYKESNIAITGAGTIDGNGAAWSTTWRKQQKPDQKRLRQMGNDSIPEDQRVFGNGFLDLDKDGQDDGFGDGQLHYLRPTAIELYACRNILLSDFTLRNSPFWNIHPVFSQYITIRGLRIEGGYLNDDGIDPDSCSDVLISDCYIATEDDAIAIKAGRDQDAWNRQGSSRIVVQNCHLNSGVNAFTIGSEMSGGVREVFVHNCKIERGKHALTFKTNLDRGGEVRDIFFKNLVIDSIQNAMFIFRMDYHGYRGNHFPTSFSGFYAEQISCQYVNGPAIKIVGVEAAPIRKVWLKDINVNHATKPNEFLFTEEILEDEVFIGR